MAKYEFNGIAFEAPADWADASIITLVGPELGGLRPTVVVTREPVGEPNLEAYAKRQSEQLAGSTVEYALHRFEPLVLGGRNGHLLEHSFKTGQGGPFRQVQVFAVRAGTVVALSLTHRAELFEQLRPTFDELIRTYRIA
jgi:hypothetical protein